MSRKNNGSMKQIGSSHRGRRGKIKDNPNPETSDGEKTSILSMNISDIGKALRASSSKTSKKADLPAEWNVRANLLPRSIVTLNRDRAIKYLLSYDLIFVPRLKKGAGSGIAGKIARHLVLVQRSALRAVVAAVFVLNIIQAQLTGVRHFLRLPVRRLRRQLPAPSA